MLRENFALDELHLGLERAAPEFAVEVLAGAGFARAVFVAGGVAEGIDVNEVVAPQRGEASSRLSTSTTFVLTTIFEEKSSPIPRSR